MGIKFFDIYSPSHALGGMTFYLLGIDIKLSIILHTFFEIFENYFWVNKGGYCIKLPFMRQKDCKTKPDSIQNIIGDTIFFILGFLIGLYLIKKPYLENIHFFIKLMIIGLVVPLGYSVLTTNIVGYLPKFEHE